MSCRVENNSKKLSICVLIGAMEIDGPRISFYSMQNVKLMSGSLPLRLILKYLVAVSLPLGFFPRYDLLQEFDLSFQYQGLIEAVKVRTSPKHPEDLVVTFATRHPFAGGKFCSVPWAPGPLA